MSNKHERYLVFDEAYIGERKDVFVRSGELPPAIYEVSYDSRTDRTTFSTINLHMDEILELPDSLMKKVVDLIEQFWSADLTEKYALYNLVQKLGILLHGSPGTGKTIIMARIAKKVIEMGGVILFNPRVDLLANTLKVIREVEPKKKIVVLWEEFDSIVNQDESALLCMLDGEIQIDNVVYLATTNYISKIPARIKNRPSRFAKVWEVKAPTKAARKAYFTQKIKTEEDREKFVGPLTESSDGLTIDQCKDLLINCVLYNEPIHEAVHNLKEINKEHSLGYDDYAEQEAKEIFSKNKKLPTGKSLKPL